MLGDIDFACSRNPDIEGVGSDPNTCLATSSKEWPGSGSMYSASLVTQMDFEAGSLVESGLHCVPSTPSMDGLIADFIHPMMWSKERFSRTRTTIVFIGV